MARDVSAHVSVLEGALTKEIQRRGGLERHMSDLVQHLVAREVRAMRLDTEGQTVSLVSRGIAALRERLAAVEYDVSSVKGRMDAVELGARRWASPLDPGGGSGCRLGAAADPGVGPHAMALMEDRLASVERSLGRPLDALPVEAARQLQIMRKELVEECVCRCSVSVERARADFRETRLRLEELENWLRDSWLPEIVRLQLGMQASRSGHVQQPPAAARRSVRDGEARTPRPSEGQRPAEARWSALHAGDTGEERGSRRSTAASRAPPPDPEPVEEETGYGSWFAALYDS